MKIYFEKDNKTLNHKITKPTKLKDILKKYNISKESVILVKNNAVCLDDSIVSDSDELKILSVVSGG